jgi:hypothetical protein
MPYWMGSFPNPPDKKVPFRLIALVAPSIWSEDDMGLDVNLKVSKLFIKESN